MAKRTVPETHSEQIAFFRSHAPRWLENAAAIGVSPELAAELQLLVDEAAAAFKAQ